MAPAGPPHRRRPVAPRRRRQEASGVASRGICVLARRAAPEAAAPVTSRDPRGRAESASRGAWWRPREAADGPSAPPPVVVPAASPPRLRPVSCSSGRTSGKDTPPSVAQRAVRRVERWTEATRTATRLLPRAPSRAAAGAGAEQASPPLGGRRARGRRRLSAASLRPCGSPGRRGPAILPRGPPPLPTCQSQVVAFAQSQAHSAPETKVERSRNTQDDRGHGVVTPCHRSAGRVLSLPPDQEVTCAPGTSEAASVPVPGRAPAQGGPALGLCARGASRWQHRLGARPFPRFAAKEFACIHS